MKAGINAARGTWDAVWGPEQIARAKQTVTFDETAVWDQPSEDQIIAALRGAEVALCTWGTLPFSQRLLDGCPDLKLVLYAAGSVKGFVTDALIARNVVVCSAVQQNAQPVAEFTLGLILASLKGVFQHNNRFKAAGRTAWAAGRAAAPAGYYHSKVGLLGWGTITRILVRLLGAFQIDVYVNDPYLNTETAGEHAVTIAEVDWIMANCDVISVHHADVPKNWNLINKARLDLMRPGTALINTSRGRMINEADLVERLQRGDITAHLDVTHPEPPAEGHPFYTLPNCFLTPHVAGSIGPEVRRMSAAMVDELERFADGRQLQFQVDLRSLADRA